jgi:hypothetical protein
MNRTLIPSVMPLKRQDAAESLLITSAGPKPAGLGLKRHSPTCVVAIPLLSGGLIGWDGLSGT